MEPSSRNGNWVQIGHFCCICEESHSTHYQNCLYVGLKSVDGSYIHKLCDNFPPHVVRSNAVRTDHDHLYKEEAAFGPHFLTSKEDHGFLAPDCVGNWNASACIHQLVKIEDCYYAHQLGIHLRQISLHGLIGSMMTSNDYHGLLLQNPLNDVIIFVGIYQSHDLYEDSHQ